jgi:hypothetical protein
VFTNASPELAALIQYNKDIKWSENKTEYFTVCILIAF